MRKHKKFYIKFYSFWKKINIIFLCVSYLFVAFFACSLPLFFHKTIPGKLINPSKIEVVNNGTSVFSLKIIAEKEQNKVEQYVVDLTSDNVHLYLDDDEFHSRGRIGYFTMCCKDIKKNKIINFNIHIESSLDPNDNSLIRNFWIGPCNFVTSYKQCLGYSAETNDTFLVKIKSTFYDDVIQMLSSKIINAHHRVSRKTKFMYELPYAIFSFVVCIFEAWYMSKFIKIYSGRFGQEKSTFLNNMCKVKFADVAGSEEEKKEVNEIVYYLKHPKKYLSIGAKAPKGVLFYGPPGTGKTLLAKAIAGEAGVPFFFASASEFEDTFVGVGARRIRNLFNMAKKFSPSIIFIDEIDSLAKSRSLNSHSQTINQLLIEMDSFDTDSNVIIMAATNQYEALDDAILRPGRFDRHIKMSLPNLDERQAILKIHAKNKKLSPSINLEHIAKLTIGFSGAELANILNESVLLAIRNKRDFIDNDDIYEAIDRVFIGISKPLKKSNDERDKQVAVHEVGHAIIDLCSKENKCPQVTKITIIPRGEAQGYTSFLPNESLETKSTLLLKIRSSLGGHAAESHIYGENNVSIGATTDLKKATTIATKMVVEYGMTSLGAMKISLDNSQIYSDNTKSEIDSEVRRIIKREYYNATKIINDNKKEFDLFVNALLKWKTITKDTIYYIHENKKIPSDIIKQKSTSK